uniref:Uncharacterized protein n=1 Tax=Onchocerca volvulus TaxID=6282 RepID=A0A8R1TZ66_ONCVO
MFSYGAMPGLDILECILKVALKHSINLTAKWPSLLLIPVLFTSHSIPKRVRRRDFTHQSASTSSTLGQVSRGLVEPMLDLSTISFGTSYIKINLQNCYYNGEG